MGIPLLLGVLAGITAFGPLQPPAAAQSANTGQDTRAPADPPEAGLSAERRTPFHTLFVPHAEPPASAVRFQPARARPVVATAQEPEIVCGIKVWKVDPTIDPGIAKQVPDDGTDFKIRRLHPPPCPE